MFKANSAISIRLSRWLSLVLFASIFTSLPLISPNYANKAFANTFSSSWSTATGTLTTSSPTNGIRGAGFYVARHSLTGVADGTTVAIYMRARQGTVGTVTMGNYDAYLYIVNKTDNSVVRQDDDSGGGDGTGSFSSSNDSYLTVVWQSTYEIQATSYGGGSTGGYALYASQGTLSGAVSNLSSAKSSVQLAISTMSETAASANPFRVIGSRARWSLLSPSSEKSSAGSASKDHPLTIRGPVEV